MPSVMPSGAQPPGRGIEDGNGAARAGVAASARMRERGQRGEATMPCRVLRGGAADDGSSRGVGPGWGLSDGTNGGVASDRLAGAGVAGARRERGARPAAAQAATAAVEAARPPPARGGP